MKQLLKKIKRKSKSFIKKIDLKKRLLSIKEDKLIIKFIKENNLFLIFVGTGILNEVLLRVNTIGGISQVFSFRPIFADLTLLIIIGSIGFLIKERNRINYYLPVSIVLTALCLINAIYYTYYSSFASFSMLSLTQYVNEVGDAVSIIFSPVDIIYLLAPVLLIIVNYRNKKRYKKEHVITHIETRRKSMFKVLGVGGTLLVLYLLTMSSLDVSRFNSQWNKEYIVMRFGTYIYQINDAIASIQPQVNSLFGYEEAKRNFEEYFEDTVPEVDNEYTDMFKDKNVLVIHAESIQTILFDMKFNNQEVLPNLSKIANEGLYFSNFYAQVSVGTSSDTELTYNTSLMPTQSGTAFVSYPDKTYIATPNLMQDLGYYTFSMHANNADFWNRRTMYQTIGYERFYSKTDYEVTEENTIGLGLSDKDFFKQSMPYLKDINENNEKWYGLMIQLSNHTPFADVDKYGEFPVDIKETVNGEEVVYPYLEGTTFGNYIKSAHYADAALGELFTSLENEALLEDTVIVIYGDHDARISKKDYDLYYNYDRETNELYKEDDPRYVPYDTYMFEMDKKVPFIIWSKDLVEENKNKEITNVMGMYDVMPTLGNMVGFDNKYALGNDIFNIKDKNIVVFPDGNWVTNDIYYDNQKGEYSPITKNPISQEQIDYNNEYVTNLLKVSNDMIVHDLLNEDNPEGVE